MLTLAVALLLALVLADAALWALAVAPALAGLAAHAIALPGSNHPCPESATVALLAFMSSLWIVRRYPRDAPSRSRSNPWLGVAFSAGIGLVSATLALSRLAPASVVPVATGLLVAAAVQSLSIPVYQRLFHRRWKRVVVATAGSARHRQAVLDRYVHLPPGIRFWARGKLRFDPLFENLDRHVPASGRILDVGCGYALPAVWLAALHPNLHFSAMDPVRKRVRIARHVLDGRAHVDCMAVDTWTRQGAHDAPYDGVLCIDVLHHLRAPEAFLRAAAERIVDDGVLVLRTTVRGNDSLEETFSHRLERCLVRLRGQNTVRFYGVQEVEKLLTDAGFFSVHVVRSAGRHTETLFVAKKS